MLPQRQEQIIIFIHVLKIIHVSIIDSGLTTPATHVQYYFIHSRKLKGLDQGTSFTRQKEKSVPNTLIFLPLSDLMILLFPFSKVSYTVLYSNSSTDIVSVMVNFSLGSVTAQLGLGLKQKVSVRFSKVWQFALAPCTGQLSCT